MASASYGEGSSSNNREELFGISSAIVNNNNLRGSDASLSKTILKIANAASDGNERFGDFNTLSAVERNENPGMTTAIAGAINALTGGTDYSNGATGWDGADLKTNSHRFGLNIAHKSHDLYKVGDRPLSVKENGSLYRRQTTSSHGGTVFMRIHPTYVKGGGRAY